MASLSLANLPALAGPSYSNSRTPPVMGTPPVNTPPVLPPPMPVGEDNWIDFIEQKKREADNFDKRVQVIELFRKAVSAEIGSLKVWLAYCEYFWSLRHDAQPYSGSGWTQEDQERGNQAFTLDAALHVWADGHESTKYRLHDSWKLWNRWIGLEQELLGSSRTPVGIKRITHLYRNRLQTPHASWDHTSSCFSSFLSEHSPDTYERVMTEVTEQAKEAKRLYDERDLFEMRLEKAERQSDKESEMTVMREYLAWEMDKVRPRAALRAESIKLGLGLFSRALTGIFAADESIWQDYIYYVSNIGQLSTDDGAHPDPQVVQALPKALDVLQRAVLHCPWSGKLWARYILSGEEAGLSFYDMERIKHAATNHAQLDRDGMTAVVDMYAAWCGYLKRTAMSASATDEAADLADSGLSAALEAVHIWGIRRFGDAYQGDPNFRLERIMIQFLTEKHGAIKDARARWVQMSKTPLYANSYDFWVHYFLWEMMIFQLDKGKQRSPTPSTLAAGVQTPQYAARVLEQALRNPNLDWPERIMEVYLHHCNDYQKADHLHRALDTMHRVTKNVAQRRAKETEAANAAYAAQAQETQAQAASQGPSAAPEAGHSLEQHVEDSPSSAKRKREDVGEVGDENSSKRIKNEANAAKTLADANPQDPKRDRENRSILVENLPCDASSAKIRGYFKDYGTVVNVEVTKEADRSSSSALLEFKTPEDVQAALIRHGKYYGEQVISVKPATRLNVFVTNFPPTYDERALRQLFRNCGPIFSIRFPSLKYKTTRRFCYITFRTQEGSAEALRLDGTQVDGRYKLQVQYSDPQRKKGREGAIAEGREIVAKALSSHTDEKTLESVFGKYGTVSRINVLRNISGNSKGVAFITYETKEAADSAISELNDTKLQNNVIRVEAAASASHKPTARAVGAGSPSPAPDGDGQDHKLIDGKATGEDNKDSKKERSFALLGIPDTVNVARVRAAIESHAELVKVVLRPDHGGAIVELKDVAAVGKVQLALEGLELDHSKIRVGTIGDLMQEKGEVKSSRMDKGSGATKAAGLMPPPQMVKRPMLGGIKKKRLAFQAPVIPSKVEDSGNKDGGVNGVAPKPKSNADFREMILKSGDEEAGAKAPEDKMKDKEDAKVDGGS